MRGWYYTNRSGARQFEELSAEQMDLDAQLVESFRTFETTFGDNRDPEKLHKNDIAEFIEAIDVLPPRRRAHWVSEMSRIALMNEPTDEELFGESEPAPQVPESPAEPPAE